MSWHPVIPWPLVVLAGLLLLGFTGWRVVAVPGLVPDVLRQSDRFRDEVTDVLDAMLQGSVAGAVAREAAL